MADVDKDIEDQKFIKQLLRKKGPLLTDDVFEEMKLYKKEQFTPDCNDRTLRNLIFLKQKGLIKGKINRKKKTWEWSV